MVTFDYYLYDYNGQCIKSEEEFKSVLNLATKYVMKATNSKGTLSEIGEAICAVCDVLIKNLDSVGIKSESADGVSVTYTDERCEKLIYNALKLYLPSKLLYRGI